MQPSHVMTVQGSLPGHQLGRTLIHEHLYMDATRLLAAHAYPMAADPRLTMASAADARWNPGGYPDNYRLTEVQLVIEELAPFRSAGGQTVVETTPVGLGRNPRALLQIARQGGVHVVMGCGYYIEPTHPAGLADRAVDDIAADLVDEFINGVGDTGIRPGIIGEIGTSDPMTPAEARVVRACARAQRETGLAISVHLHPWGHEGPAVLEVVEDEGVDPSKVILNHVTTAVTDDTYQRSLLERGVYVAYDLFGFDHSLLSPGRYPPSDADVVRKVVELATGGFAERLLISQDVGVRTRLLAYGGWGYAHLLDRVVPLLRAAGLDDSGIDTLLVANPARVLASPA